MPLVNLRIYSPRWGHDDTYSVNFERDFLEISMTPRTARADWRENQDPLWTGESLTRIMNNDSIYPPHNIQRLIEYAWISWRAGNISDQQIELELLQIQDWLNTITKSKPNTDFWNSYF